MIIDSYATNAILYHFSFISVFPNRYNILYPNGLFLLNFKINIKLKIIYTDLITCFDISFLALHQTS